MDALTYMSADPDVRAAYQARIREMNRIRASQAIEYKEGLAEGEKLGARKEREKAKAEKIESAKKMLSKGLSIEDISDFTGLSLEEVKKL